MSKIFNVTDSYENKIKAIVGGENLNEFPLLSKVKIYNGNLSELIQITGNEQAVFNGSSGSIAKGKDVVSVVPQGLVFDLELEDSNRVSADGINSAINRVAYVLLRSVESHLVFGQTSVSGYENSPIRGALFYGKSDKYNQGLSDVMFIKNNDFAPVQKEVTKLETAYFKTGAAGISDIVKGVVINPNFAQLVGNLTPQINVYKDLSSNRIKVIGSVQVSGGFDDSSCVKYF